MTDARDQTKKRKLKKPTITHLFWTIYILLLLVLLPHTAWAFGKHQQEIARWGTLMAWALAVVFEAGLFAFTHQLKGRIEEAHKLRSHKDERRWTFHWRKFSTAYLNVFSIGLMFCSGVSALANFSYAVEFASPFKTFGQYSFSPLAYELAFGGILPIISFLFARVLAATVDVRSEQDVALVAVKKSEAKWRKETEAARTARDEAIKKLGTLRQTFGQYEALTQGAVRDKILAAHNLWPGLHKAGIAAVTGAAPSYVMQVLAETNGKAK